MKFSVAAAFLAANLALTTATYVPRQGGGGFITAPCKSDSECNEGCCGFNTGKCAGVVVALGRDGGCGFGATPNADAARAKGFTQQADAFDAQQGGKGAGKAAGAADGKAAGAADGKAAGAADGAAAGGAAAGGAANAAAGGAAAGGADAGAAAGGAAAGGAAGGKGSGKAPGTQFITGPCGSDADCGSGCCGFNTGKCAGAVVAQERDGGCGFGSGTPNDDAAKALTGAARRGLYYLH